jgi:MATE family multidrug resistance protein
VALLKWQGHIGNGELELTAAALGLTFTAVTGLSVGTGLLCALDTICSQAHGAGTKCMKEQSCGHNYFPGNHRKVGLVVQRALLIVSLACIPFATIWFFAGPIFLACRLHPEVSSLAGLYCRYPINSAHV